MILDVILNSLPASLALFLVYDSGPGCSSENETVRNNSQVNIKSDLLTALAASS